MDKPPYLTVGSPKTGSPLEVQEPEPLPPWTLRDTIIGVCVTVIPWIAIAGALQMGKTNATPRVEPFSLDLVSAIVIFLVTAIFEGVFLLAPFWYGTLKYSRRSWAERNGGRAIQMRDGLAALGFRSFRLWGTIGLITVSMVIIFGADLGYGALITGLHLPIQTNDQVIEMQAKYAPLTAYALLAGAIFIAPFCEEIFFRGFVFQGLRRRLSVPWAVVLSALIFGIAHADPGSFPVLFIIGLVLAVVRWRTRSIWPGMALHMLNNMISALSIVALLHGAI